MSRLNGARTACSVANYSSKSLLYRIRIILKSIKKVETLFTARSALDFGRVWRLQGALDFRKFNFLNEE
jgi:hypothetical protein